MRYSGSYWRYGGRYIEMAGVKTAVSLRESLFQQVEALAREMKAPRSRPFAPALEHFRRRPQDRQLLRRINFDSSRICTVVVCAHAFSLRRASAPRNMLLEKDEAALPEQNLSLIHISEPTRRTPT